MGIPIEFSERFLQKAKRKIPLFEGVPSTRAKGTWIPANRKPYGVVVKEHESHAEICFQEKKEADSNWKFDQIERHRKEIERIFGEELRWERLSEKKRSKIMTYPIQIGYLDTQSWDILIDQLIDIMARFIAAVEGAKE
jgi:hypothetical protein